MFQQLDSLRLRVDEIVQLLKDILKELRELNRSNKPKETGLR
jgi:hypothetical protein